MVSSVFFRFFFLHLRGFRPVLAGLALCSLLGSLPVQAEDARPATAGKAVADSVGSRMFGAQLFGGSFAKMAGGGIPQAYVLNTGDRIKLKLWGSMEFDDTLTVDADGQVVVPGVGAVKLAGVRHDRLNATVSSGVRKLAGREVQSAAQLDASQPVKVFVTGFVRQPGLYGGVAADSVLAFLDRAGGVDAERGSYIDIVLKRGDAVYRRINLYDFLLRGNIDFFPLADGDAIVVGARRHVFSVRGEVLNPFDFEFDQPIVSLTDALALAHPRPGATHVSVLRSQGTRQMSEYYPLAEARKEVMLYDGDQLNVTADRYAGTIQVRIEGAHSGEHALVLPYGATMGEVLDHINANSMSRLDQLQLYRKSVAERQREMLNISLQKLQETALSARSSTSEEASLRTQEAALIAKFVEQARKVEPKGQVVLNEKTAKTMLLEDGDIIRIPRKTSVVMVHGEVLFPAAVSWESGLRARDYIDLVGGYTQSSDTSKVVLIRPNGEAIQASGRTKIEAGDEVMVLPKVESKNIEVTRGISQILYQIAVAAKVILDL